MLRLPFSVVCQGRSSRKGEWLTRLPGWRREARNKSHLWARSEFRNLLGRGRPSLYSLFRFTSSLTRTLPALRRAEACVLQQCTPRARTVPLDFSSFH